MEKGQQTAEHEKRPKEERTKRTDREEVVQIEEPKRQEKKFHAVESGSNADDAGDESGGSPGSPSARAPPPAVAGSVDDDSPPLVELSAQLDGAWTTADATDPVQYALELWTGASATAAPHQDLRLRSDRFITSPGAGLARDIRTEFYVRTVADAMLRVITRGQNLIFKMITYTL